MQISARVGLSHFRALSYVRKNFHERAFRMSRPQPKQKKEPPKSAICPWHFGGVIRGRGGGAGFPGTGCCSMAEMISPARIWLILFTGLCRRDWGLNSGSRRLHSSTSHSKQALGKVRVNLISRNRGRPGFIVRRYHARQTGYTGGF